MALQAHHVHEKEHREDSCTYEDLSDDAGLAEGPEHKDEQAGGDDDDGRLEDEEREGELERVEPLPDAVGGYHHGRVAHHGAGRLGQRRRVAHLLRDVGRQLFGDRRGVHLGGSSPFRRSPERSPARRRALCFVCVCLCHARYVPGTWQRERGLTARGLCGGCARTKGNGSNGRNMGDPSLTTL
jgi:hypothetical protein